MFITRRAHAVTLACALLFSLFLSGIASAQTSGPGIIDLEAALEVTGDFTEDSYAVGDKAVAEVTIKNVTDAPVTGIRFFPEFSLGNASVPIPNIAPFDLAAGDSKSFTFPKIVGKQSGWCGVLEFSFALFQTDVAHSTQPRFRAIAPVESVKADMSVLVWQYLKTNTEPADGGIPALPIVLTSILDENVTVAGTTDATGKVVLPAVQPGLYRVELGSKWRVAGPALGVPGLTGLCNSGKPTTQHLSVVSTEERPTSTSPTTAPPAATTDVPTSAPGTVTTTTTKAPVPQASPADELADTGASVVGLALTGFAILGAGVGAVLFSRRRKANV